MWRKAEGYGPLCEVRHRTRITSLNFWIMLTDLVCSAMSVPGPAEAGLARRATSGVGRNVGGGGIRAVGGVGECSPVAERWPPHIQGSPMQKHTADRARLILQGWERWLYVLAGVGVLLAVLEAQWQTLGLLLNSPLGPHA